MISRTRQYPFYITNPFTFSYSVFTTVLVVCVVEHSYPCSSSCLDLRFTDQSMLLRASRRTLQNDAYRQASATVESIQLPFLCPALFRHSRHPRKTSSTVPTRSTVGVKDPRVQSVSNAPPHRRHLASAAAAAAEYAPQVDYHVPFDIGPNPGYNYTPQNVSALRPFDPNSSPIIINDTLATHPKSFRAKDAIGGNLNEIHQNLHACLQVGRLQRAAALMRRLNQIYKPGAPGLLAAHNEYVKELSYRISQTKDQHLLQHLQRWFIVDLKEAGVEPSPEIYVWMIQASLQTSDTRKDRTVRRYVNLVKEAGLYDETMSLLSGFQKSLVCHRVSVSSHCLFHAFRLLLRAVEYRPMHLWQRSRQMLWGRPRRYRKTQ